MWHHPVMAYVGVDGCQKGWIAVILSGDRPCRAVFVSELAELATAVGEDIDGVAVDIPIGVPTAGRRRADLLVREQLGPRRSSVFFTPVRAALTASSYPEAVEVSREQSGFGVSRQAYALGPKILEAERWVASVSFPVWEVHPELSFAVLLGRPAGTSKKTWAGTRERLAGLRAVGIDLGDLGIAGAMAAVDDVFDAAVCAWSARRLGNGEGKSVPDPPDVDPESGRRIAIFA